MKDKAEKSIQSLTGAKCAPNGALSRLLQLSERYAVLEAKIQEVASPRLRDQIQVVQVDNHVLILSVRSPTWVARARLEGQELLKCARLHWDETLNEVRVIVGPATKLP